MKLYIFDLDETLFKTYDFLEDVGRLAKNKGYISAAEEKKASEALKAYNAPDVLDTYAGIGLDEKKYMEVANSLENSYLYEDAEGLKRFEHVFILTTGNPILQKIKIQKSGLDYAYKIVEEDKAEYLGRIIKDGVYPDYSDQSFDEIYLVDDKPKVLENALKYPILKPVYIKRKGGKYYTDSFTKCDTITSLTQL